MTNSQTHASALPFNGLHPRNPCNYVDYYLFTDPEGMEGWVGLVGWSIADALPTRWSHVNRRSGTYQGKSASLRPTPLPLSHAANRAHWNAELTVSLRAAAETIANTYFTYRRRDYQAVWAWMNTGICNIFQSWPPVLVLPRLDVD